MKILNMGSLNIDYVYSVDHHVRVGETLSSDSLEIFSGGKGLNQSIAMSKAGLPVIHCGIIGKDGVFLLEELKKANVSVELIKVEEKQKTGHAMIQIDREGSNSILLYSGTNHAFSEKMVEEVLESFEKGDCIVLQNEINQLDYILKRSKEKGMTIFLNPSPIDETLLSCLHREIDYLILNEVEAADILGQKEAKKLDPEKQARLLSQKFPKTKIVLTLGRKGSLYSYQGYLHYQPSVEVRTVDTTAAGDTYTGYFIAGVLQGMGIEKAMALSANAAALKVTRKGAGPSIPWLSEVQQAFLC